MKIQKILMVDDDDPIRRVGELSLKRVGRWDVIACRSAADALVALSEFTPDVILLDVMMPELDGITAFPQLQSKTNHSVPIIFMTAKVMNHEVKRYMELGAAGVISKPFETLTLPAEIQHICDEFYSGSHAAACKKAINH